MNKITASLPQTNIPLHLVRPRINALLTKALKKPIVIVVASAGYGKTRAVYDFLSQSEIPFLWMQLSNLDNVGTRFWENFVRVLVQSQLGEGMDKELIELGFPDTEDKISKFIEIWDRLVVNRRYVFVLDDLHLVNNPDVLRFLEHNEKNTIKDCTTIIICRELPKFNIVSMAIKDLVYNITEEDLNFTESELGTYLSRQGLSVTPQTLHEISQDTRGWAFSVNLIARSLHKAPAYMGYVRTAIKQNLFMLMEAEVWNMASEQLCRFWTRLSLIEHLSIDLVTMMTGGDEGLLTELHQQSSYVRFDRDIGAYLIHHLFLDFLRTKQDILTDEEKRETYRVAAKLCEQNDFTIDAISYYEKLGDYKSIVKMLFNRLYFLAPDFALHMVGIFERTPAERFIKVDFLAAMHLRALFSLGRWHEVIALAGNYEQQLKKLPEDDILRKHTLCLIYYCWGYLRFMMATADHRYDCDIYFSKMLDCRTNPPIDMEQMYFIQAGLCTNISGSAKKGAPQEFINEALLFIRRVNECFEHKITGIGDILKGELLFYQGDIGAAEPLITSASARTWDCRQFEFAHRSLLYTMRIAIFQGKYKNAEAVMKYIEALLGEKDYPARFMSYDIALGWYHYILRQPELVPVWLKEKFIPYSHAYTIENAGNQVKARYHYLTKNYQPLLTYIEEMKQRESTLFGRLEMLAMEACVHYQMKDKKVAFKALRDAYKTASPNSIIMPFIELGKDMRTLTMAALSEPDCGIPQEWLETVKRKSALYAKYQSTVISDYERENDISGMKALSFRETEILHDLCKGLSRPEIAEKQEISLSTVKMNVNHIYEKLKANSIVDVIRIATEQKLV